jgi:DNA end-binding protein Ku
VIRGGGSTFADVARAIWTGAINFGLVNVPVRLATAVTQRELRFHLLHDEDGARIHQVRVCSADGMEVPWDHVTKGYEIEKGRYVTLTREELERHDPSTLHTIAISDFVDLAAIDPVYYDVTYHVIPERGGEHAYALLYEAMSKSGRVAIARIILRTRASLCALRPRDGALALSTMRWADEVVDAPEEERAPAAKTKTKSKELEMAEQLIDALSQEWDPSRYHDEYREEVLALIEQKAAGHEIAVAPEAAPVSAPRDLEAALKKSLVGHTKAVHHRRARKKRAS